MRAPVVVRCAVLNCGFLPRAAFRACVLVLLVAVLTVPLAAKHRRARNHGTRARMASQAAVPDSAQVPDTQGLDAIIAEMQRPLPPLEWSSDAVPAAVATPPAATVVPSVEATGESTWQMPVILVLVCSSLVFFAWLRRPARQHAFVEGPMALPDAPRLPQPVARTRRQAPTLLRALPNPIRSASRLLPPPQTLVQAAKPVLKPVLNSKPAPKPAPKPELDDDALSMQQIVLLKAQDSFASWRELLKSARCGNPLARQILRGNPRHSAIRFTLDAEEFKSNLRLARNLEFSGEWMRQILTLLRLTECFDERVEITSPLGQVHEILIDAPIANLNTVLGYENLDGETRRQLELRRWILWNTRIDGTEQPEILAAFPLRPAA